MLRWSYNAIMLRFYSVRLSVLKFSTKSIMFVLYYRVRFLSFVSICPSLFSFVDRKIGEKYCYSKIISFDILLRDPTVVAKRLEKLSFSATSLCCKY